jgi:hypothetical protein
VRGVKAAQDGAERGAVLEEEDFEKGSENGEKRSGRGVEEKKKGEWEKKKEEGAYAI